MANVLYPKGKKKILDADIDLLVDTIKVVLIKNTYTYDPAHEFYSSVNTHVLNTPQTLANRTTTDGVFDADDVTFTSVTAGDTANAIALIKDTGVAATSPLIAYFDDITYFPAVTNGSDVVIQWSNGAAKIFAI